jgi:predicted permease
MSHESLEARLVGSVREYSRARGGTPLQLRASAVKGTPFGDMMSLILPFVFGASVLLTLLIACANVAILIIAQWTTRERETAVRAALGASRWRAVRALLAESIVLAAIAGVLGVGATFVLRAILVGRTSPEFMNLAIDPSIFWQAALITILTGVAAGLGPALFETRRLQLDPLRGLATSDRVRQRWSHALVVVEITVTLALLVVTTSMIDAYQRGRDADFGFDPDAFVVGTVNGISVPAGDVVETLRSIPGVQAAAAATGAPFAGRGPIQPLAADAAGTNAVRAERLDVSTGFFETLGLRVHAGRTFTAADEGTRGVAVLNQAAAAQLLGGAGVGRQVWVNGRPHDVVGIVADYASTPVEQRLPMPKVFLLLPASSRVETFLRFVVRGAGPAALVQPVRRTLKGASPNDVIATGTFRQVLDVQGQEMLLGTAPFLPLIVIGLLLTSSGVYGVLAFAIARRSRELAVRVAIGAAPRDQVRLVIARSARLVGAGLVFGVGVTFGLSRVVRAAGGAGSLYDPPWHAFVIPVAIVIAVGAVATWLPTRRVLRINPARLLAN